MGMTMTQKILAKHAGLASVEAGQLIEAGLDLVLGNDVTTPVAIHEMEKFNKKEVFDKSKIALVMDHFTPNKDIKSAENSKSIRRRDGNRACTSSGKRTDRCRRDMYRSRFTYMYLRCPWCILHRCRKYRYGSRYGDR